MTQALVSSRVKYMLEASSGHEDLAPCAVLRELLVDNENEPEKQFRARLLRQFIMFLFH